MQGEEVKDRPVYPVDLLGSIYHLAGIDPAARLPIRWARSLRASRGRRKVNRRTPDRIM